MSSLPDVRRARGERVLRETLTRVLRSYRFARADAAAGLLSLPAFASQKTDCDFDPDAWDRGEQSGLAAAGFGRVVLRRLPATAAAFSLAESVDWRAVIDPPADAGRASLAALHAAGVRGVRFDPGLAGDDSLEAMLKFADRIVPFGWHLEIDVAMPGAARALAKAEWSLMRLPLAVCFTGLRRFRPGRRADDADLQFLFGLVQLGRYWLKLSSDDLVPPQLKLWDEMPPLARALQTVRKDRLIWGSGKHASDSAAHVASSLAMLEKCLPHPADQEQVLVDNPARLYGFESRKSL